MIGSTLGPVSVASSTIQGYYEHAPPTYPFGDMTLWDGVIAGPDHTYPQILGFRDQIPSQGQFHLQDELHSQDPIQPQDQFQAQDQLQAPEQAVSSAIVDDDFQFVSGCRPIGRPGSVNASTKR